MHNYRAPIIMLTVTYDLVAINTIDILYLFATNH
jgi:hypothetical protein